MILVDYIDINFLVHNSHHQLCVDLMLLQRAVLLICKIFVFQLDVPHQGRPRMALTAQDLLHIRQSVSSDVYIYMYIILFDCTQ